MARRVGRASAGRGTRCHSLPRAASDTAHRAYRHTAGARGNPTSRPTSCGIDLGAVLGRFIGEDGAHHPIKKRKGDVEIASGHSPRLVMSLVVTHQFPNDVHAGNRMLSVEMI